MRYRVAIILLFLLFTACRQSLIERGNICLALGDYAMAMDFFRRHLDGRPDSFEARLGLGKSLLQKYVDSGGDQTSWQNAMTQLEACQTLRPDAPLGRLMSDAYLERSQRYLSQADTINALSTVSLAIDHNPDNVESLILAGILAYRGGFGQKSAVLFQKALALDSLNVAALFNLGMIYWDQSDYVIARDHLIMALEISPDDKDILEWFALADEMAEKAQ